MIQYVCLKIEYKRQLNVNSKSTTIANMDLQKHFDNQVKNKWFEWAKNAKKSLHYRDEQLISKNPNLTIEIIRNNPNVHWDWEEISKNPAITMDDVENNLDLPWECWEGLSLNPNLTMEFVMKHFNSDWDEFAIQENIKIPINMLQKYPKFKWNITALKANEFSIDKQHYIAHHTKNTNLLKMHDFFNKNTDKVVKPIEYVIFDEYLLKQILQY
jgi:hypothetical protein